MSNDYAIVHKERKAAPIAPEMEWMQNRTKEDAIEMAHNTAEKENRKWQSDAQ
jgi:hypothetical protein